MFGSHLETWERKRILSGSEGEVAGLGGPGLELREEKLSSCPTGPPRGAVRIQQAEAGVETQS